jgi:hypothetical protein
VADGALEEVTAVLVSTVLPIAKDALNHANLLVYIHNPAVQRHMYLCWH